MIRQKIVLPSIVFVLLISNGLDMKKIKTFSAIVLCAAITTFLISCSSSKKTTAPTGVAVQNLVDSQRFVFVAQTVFPMSGRSRQVTPDFNMVVTTDSIISNLPYFGRAFTAPINPAEGGIRFTSTNFEYDLRDNQKGKWDIVIRPKDASGIREVNMTIFENGSATVQVASINRQPISYNGYIDRRG